MPCFSKVFNFSPVSYGSPRDSSDFSGISLHCCLSLTVFFKLNIFCVRWERGLLITQVALPPKYRDWPLWRAGCLCGTERNSWGPSRMLLCQEAWRVPPPWAAVMWERKRRICVNSAAQKTSFSLSGMWRLLPFCKTPAFPIPNIHLHSSKSCCLWTFHKTIRREKSLRTSSVAESKGVLSMACLAFWGA